MKSERIGLVLEGGGMRGVYTSGVLDAFMEENIHFPYIIGVSAGANNGAAFLTEQKKRNEKVFVDYASHKEFSGLKHLIKKGNYFNMDFIFDVLPNELEPVDYDKFFSSDTVFKCCATNALTGEAEYFEKADYDQDKEFVTKVLRASSSLPGLSKPVEINGQLYFDGGIADSIPLNQSIKDGNRYHVIVLTRNKGYRNENQYIDLYSKYFLREYPQVIKALENRHTRYNETLEKIEKLEEEGLAFIFRPIKETKIRMLEKDPSALRQLYEQGYSETKESMKDFETWRQMTLKE